MTAKQERAAIVKWLMGESVRERRAGLWGDFHRRTKEHADAIERGDHHKGE